MKKVIVGIIAIVLYAIFIVAFIITIKDIKKTERENAELKIKYNNLQEEHKMMIHDFDAKIEGCYYKLKRLGE